MEGKNLIRNLEDFKGNKLTPKEKEYRLKYLKKELAEGRIDKEMIPYLEKINKFSFLVTTQSCCGHNEDSKEGRHAHIDFRSSLPPEEVIDRILKPLEEKFCPEITIQLYGLHANRLRYCIWLKNELWKEEMDYLIEILGKIKEKDRNERFK